MKKNSVLVISAICLLLFFSSSANAALEDFIKKAEEDDEAALEAYDDGYGNWTIGFGSIYNYSRNRPVRKGDKITIDEAYSFMRKELETISGSLKKIVKVPLNKNQTIALSSLGYNIGTSGLAKSTLIKKLNEGQDKASVANHFTDFVYARNKRTGILEYSKGLYNRRLLEKKLFIT